MDITVKLKKMSTFKENILNHQILLIYMDIPKKVEKIFRDISAEFGIVYGIVFGSATVGYRRKDSDLDVAVKLRKKPKTPRQILKTITKISEAFEKELGIETDVVIMNVVGMGLRYEIFKQGKVVFCSDRNAFVEDSSRTVLEYLDMKPFFQQYYEEVKQRLF